MAAEPIDLGVQAIPASIGQRAATHLSHSTSDLVEDDRAKRTVRRCGPM